MRDDIHHIGRSVLQQGPYNDRIYLMHLHPDDAPQLVARLPEMAKQQRYGKIFAKVPAGLDDLFRNFGFVREAQIPGYYRGQRNLLLMSRFMREDRAADPQMGEIRQLCQSCHQVGLDLPRTLPEDCQLLALGPQDTPAMAAIYRQVFPDYPFPIGDPDYLRSCMDSDVDFFGVRRRGQLCALSSAEKDPSALAAEMTDFATLPGNRGLGLARHLLDHMETALEAQGYSTAYTIARGLSAPMNMSYAKAGYRHGGTLVNNTRMPDGLESMNVWFKPLKAETKAQ